MSNTEGVNRWSIGELELVRIRYFDVGLPAEGFGLPPDVVAAHPITGPDWIDPAGQMLVGQAFWVIRSGDQTLVVDPCGASDDFLRTGPEAVAHQDAAITVLRDAGVDPDDVNTVVLTHLDGIGMAALVTELGWAPAFPNARYVISTAERAHITDRADQISGVEAFEALTAAGIVDVVDTLPTPHQLTPGVTLEHTGGHSAGHAAVVLSDGDHEAALLGHLAISPLHLTTADETRHDDLTVSVAAIDGWIGRSRERGTLLAGALWPTPGVAQVTSLDPVTVAAHHGDR